MALHMKYRPHFAEGCVLMEVLACFFRFELFFFRQCSHIEHVTSILDVSVLLIALDNFVKLF